MSNLKKVLCDVELLLYPQPIMVNGSWVGQPPFKKSKQYNTSIVTLCSPTTSVGIYKNDRKEYIQYREKYKYTYGEVSVLLRSFYDQNEKNISDETGLIVRFKKLIVAISDVSLFIGKDGHLDKPLVIHTILNGSVFDETCFTNPSFGNRIDTPGADSIDENLINVSNEVGLEYKLRRDDEVKRSEEPIEDVFKDDSIPF